MNLAESAFDILLSLAHGPLHGYAMIQAIEHLRDGRTMQPGLLYTTLAKLLEDKLIEETEGPKTADKRRRYYKLTQAGFQVMQVRAQAEISRAEKIQAIVGGATC